MAEKIIDPNKPHATKQDVAAYFGVTVRTVERWMNADCPHFKRGHFIRFKLADVSQFLQKGKAANT